MFPGSSEGAETEPQRKQWFIDSVWRKASKIVLSSEKFLLLWWCLILLNFHFTKNICVLLWLNWPCFAFCFVSFHSVAGVSFATLSKHFFFAVHRHQAMNSKLSVSQRPPSPQYKCPNIREAYFSILGFCCDRVQGQSPEHGSSLPFKGRNP